MHDSECPHGEPRGAAACALCRHWWRGASWRPSSDDVSRPMPDWFRVMLAEWRETGTLSVPAERLSDDRRRRARGTDDDDDRPRYS